jgi:hypothetical protein
MAAYIAAELAGVLPYTSGPLQFSTAAAIVGTTIYLIGFAVSFLLPEPRPEALDK